MPNYLDIEFKKQYARFDFDIPLTWDIYKPHPDRERFSPDHSPARRDRLAGLYLPGIQGFTGHLLTRYVAVELVPGSTPLIRDELSDLPVYFPL
jgi:hypothetical protein